MMRRRFSYRGRGGALAVIGAASAHVGTDTATAARPGPTSIIGFASATAARVADALGLDPDPGRGHGGQAAAEAGLEDHDQAGTLPQPVKDFAGQHHHAGRPRGHLERRQAPRRLLRHVRAAPRDAEHAGQDALLPDRPALREGRAPLDRDPAEGPGRAGGAGARRHAREVDGGHD